MTLPADCNHMLIERDAKPNTVRLNMGTNGASMTSTFKCVDCNELFYIFKPSSIAEDLKKAAEIETLLKSLTAL